MSALLEVLGLKPIARDPAPPRPTSPAPNPPPGVSGSTTGGTGTGTGTTPPTTTGSADPSVTQNSKQAFLRQIYDAGCRRFGTALGPEANDAHRNHFHLDLAERNGGKYCR